MKDKNRKGARKAEDIPTGILSDLNKGKIQSVNLTEWLAVDQIQLLKSVFSTVKTQDFVNDTINSIQQIRKPSTTKIIKIIGEKIALSKKKELIIQYIEKHPSDSVRCWMAQSIGAEAHANISTYLEKIYPYAADIHFGVREIAWMSIRPHFEENLEDTILLLSNWTKDKDENIRRFASESTRPRGVWCKHIEELKINPSLGLPILSSLKTDESKYVRDSVGNWLNDASKTSPEWVLQICSDWLSTSNCKEIRYIIKKAKRTIEKTK